MPRIPGSGRFTAVKQIQLEPETVDRVEQLVERDPVRHPSFSHVAREAFDIALPKLEEDSDVDEGAC